ncbi:MAG: GNAT family N-acetyltransferase [Gemmataceae bacterium]
MIRDTIPEDTLTLVRLAESTGVFKPLEIVTLREVLDDFHAENRAHGHRCFTMLDGDRVVGFAYHAAAAMTDGAWHLYWIAIDTSQHGRGFGANLLRAVEDDIRQLGGRVLFIETSSLPRYDLTRRFYVKMRYDQEAVLRDFYAAGDDMVVFRKQL